MTWGVSEGRCQIYLVRIELSGIIWLKKNVTLPKTIYVAGHDKTSAKLMFT